MQRARPWTSWLAPVALGLVLTAPGRAADVAAPAAPPASATVRALGDALADFDRNRERIVGLAGFELAYDLKRRLASDLENQSDPAPATWTPEAWTAARDGVVRLDVDLMGQLAAGAPQPLARVPGLHEFFVRAASDGTWQPVAAYVPPALGPHERVPLVVLLHGRPQTESELLALPTFPGLADARHAIIVAPYGRGNYDFGGVAEDEIYQLVDAAERALDVAPGRTYLVGYSMGGFSVFRVGTHPGAHWSAVMSIAGAITNSVLARVAFAWRDTPVYVVNGAADQSIPPRYGEQTAGALADRGLPVTFYQDPAGTHSLRTLGRVLDRAWDDMLAGTVRADTIPAHAGAFSAPAQPDAKAEKT